MNLRCMTPPNYFHMVALQEKSERIREMARKIQSNQFDLNIDSYKAYEIGINFFETEFLHVSNNFVYRFGQGIKNLVFMIILRSTCM